MTSTVSVKGLSDLQTFLQQLPEKIQKNVARGALRAGAKVVMEEAKAIAPSSPPNSENARLYGGYEGALRDSIHESDRVTGTRVVASVKAGGKGKADVFYAFWVEYGTAAHKILPKSKKALAFGDEIVHSANPRGATPHPFLRPALEKKAQEALVAAAQYMRNRLATKEGLSAAGDVEVGAK